MAGSRGVGPTLAAVVLAAIMAGGCARTQARVMPEMPALDVPAPPPRLVDPVVSAGPVEDEIVAAVPIDAAQPSVDAAAPSSAAPRTNAASPGPGGLPDIGVVGRTGGDVRPGPGTPPQTLPTARELLVAGTIRSRLAGAAANLNRVDSSVLSPNALATYDQAKRFISQAEDALKVNNLVFAETVADKAVTLASELARR